MLRFLEEKKLMCDASSAFVIVTCDYLTTKVLQSIIANRAFQDRLHSNSWWLCPTLSQGILRSSSPMFGPWSAPGSQTSSRCATAAGTAPLLLRSCWPGRRCRRASRSQPSMSVPVVVCVLSLRVCQS